MKITGIETFVVSNGFTPPRPWCFCAVRTDAGLTGYSEFGSDGITRGLVERATDKADRRRASLRLSARGRAMHARIVPIALAYEAKLYEALDAQERNAFNTLADRLFARAEALRL